MIHIFTKHICVCINTYMQKHTHKTHILLLAKTLPVLHSLCNTFYFPVQILKMELVHLFPLHLLPPIFPPKLSPRRGIFISPPPIFLLPRLPMCPQTLKDNKIAKTGEVTNQFKNSQAKVANVGMGITQFLTINLRTSYFRHFGECLLCTYLHIPGGRSSKLFVLQMSSGHYDGFCRCAQISLPI